MPPEVRKYLLDILEACDRLRLFTFGKTFADYDGDILLQSAVERQFEIAGEALNQALRLDPPLVDRIHDAPRIVAFRNRLIHGYASVSTVLVWGVLEADLPSLRADVTALLDEAEPEN